jgi:hypothetical protein
MAWSSLLT